ncbi:transglutaminase family protein [Synechococcus sp. RedBA-s]|uniref:transglutaminase-like domain-containing protein n=1 Tax=Synechococcus sp. RedBA-s TaxID=2823741 RepID=UPI0020CF4C02|nr:transglutaminase family protein [Synechococcus sp. RedBA-s]MCP9800131.1 transglutaminase family protein [Synechococcus sp. RedBA-s]
MVERALTGWGRVQAISDAVHRHVRLNYRRSSQTKSALKTYAMKAVWACAKISPIWQLPSAAANIPARYYTGYLREIEVPPPHSAMDFAGWFEVYLGGGGHVFDPHNNNARIERILIARGRDTADVSLTTSFGPSTLQSFQVWIA